MVGVCRNERNTKRQTKATQGQATGGLLKNPLPIQLVYARDLNGAIGKGGSLPWVLPADMLHFREVTKNTICIMGRKTWESMPSTLPGRPMIILSRDLTLKPPERVGLSRTIHDALGRASMIAGHFPHLTAISILGGAQVYGDFFPLASNIIETIVHTRVEGADTYLPAGSYPSAAGWELVKERTHTKDSRHLWDVDFLWWQRRER